MHPPEERDISVRSRGSATLFKIWAECGGTETPCKRLHPSSTLGQSTNADRKEEVMSLSRIKGGTVDVELWVPLHEVESQALLQAFFSARR